MKHFWRSLRFVFLALIFCLCHNGNYSIKGWVKSIEWGKDGYNAVIENKEGRQINASISRINMGMRYKKIEVGELVTVYGDSMHFGNEISITATKIKY